MRKIACLPDDDRRELFRNTADKMGLNDAIVEKDFWVCFTAYSARTAHPFQRNGAPFRFKLSKAQQVD